MVPAGNLHDPFNGLNTKKLIFRATGMRLSIEFSLIQSIAHKADIFPASVSCLFKQLKTGKLAVGSEKNEKK
jgi:hypothetical protein